MSVNPKVTFKIRALAASGLLAFGAVLSSVPVSAQSALGVETSAAQRATYADLVTLAERSELVIRAKIRKQAQVEAERAPGLRPGFARLYIEAETVALIAGRTSIGESLAYLVDVPLTAKGKAPKLKKREMILFANTVRGQSSSARGTQIQLAGKQAQLDYSPAFEQRLRPILSSLAGNDVPPMVEGVADALAVQGTLVGESETQVFLRTRNSGTATLTVLRRPGQSPVWGASWGEIIDSAARAPQPGTLRWYRLACSLPRELPSSANLARDPAARRLASSDYGFVIRQLGPCTRAITEPA